MTQSNRAWRNKPSSAAVHRPRQLLGGFIPRKGQAQLGQQHEYHHERGLTEHSTPSDVHTNPFFTSSSSSAVVKVGDTKEYWHRVSRAKEYLAGGAIEDALGEYSSIVTSMDVTGHDPRLAAVVHSEIGGIHIQQKAYRKACLEYKRAVRHAKNANKSFVPPLIHNIAVAHSLLGEDSEAMKWLAQPCVSSLPSSAALRQRLKGRSAVRAEAPLVPSLHSIDEHGSSIVHAPTTRPFARKHIVNISSYTGEASSAPGRPCTAPSLVPAPPPPEEGTRPPPPRYAKETAKETPKWGGVCLPEPELDGKYNKMLEMFAGRPCTAPVAVRVPASMPEGGGGGGGEGGGGEPRGFLETKLPVAGKASSSSNVLHTRPLSAESLRRASPTCRSTTPSVTPTPMVETDPSEPEELDTLLKRIQRTTPMVFHMTGVWGEEGALQTTGSTLVVSVTPCARDPSIAPHRRLVYRTQQVKRKLSRKSPSADSLVHTGSSREYIFSEFERTDPVLLTILQEQGLGRQRDDRTGRVGVKKIVVTEDRVLLLYETRQWSLTGFLEVKANLRREWEDVQERRKAATEETGAGGADQNEPEVAGPEPRTLAQLLPAQVLQNFTRKMVATIHRFSERGSFFASVHPDCILFNSLRDFGDADDHSLPSDAESEDDTDDDPPGPVVFSPEGWFYFSNIETEDASCYIQKRSLPLSTSQYLPEEYKGCQASAKMVPPSRKTDLVSVGLILRMIVKEVTGGGRQFANPAFHLLQWMLAPLMEQLVAKPLDTVQILAKNCLWRQESTWLASNKMVLTSQKRVETVHSYLDELIRDRLEYYIVVKRGNILKESVTAFNAMGFADLVSPLNVTFVGEQAVDYGGLANDFCTELVKSFFEPSAGLFLSEVSEVGPVVLPTPGSCLQSHSAFGKLLAKCLLDRRPLTMTLPPFFFKLLLSDDAALHSAFAVFQTPNTTPNTTPSPCMDRLPHTTEEWLIELALSDQEVAAHIKSVYSTLRTKRRAGVDAEGIGHYLDSLSLYLPCGVYVGNVLPGHGEDVKVTCEATFAHYVRWFCYEKLFACRWAQLQAVRGAFRTVELGRTLFANISCAEVTGILCGDDVLTGEAVLGSVEFRNWGGADSTPYYLCSLLRMLSSAELRLFLRLCTGLTSLPLTGLAKKIGIFRSERLFSHTCFYQLSIPEFASVSLLNDALQVAFASLKLAPQIEDDAIQ